MEEVAGQVMRVIKEFRRVNDYPHPEQVSLDSEIHLLVEDSLDWTELIFHLETEFDVDLDIDDFYNNRCAVGDVVESVRKVLRG